MSPTNAISNALNALQSADNPVHNHVTDEMPLYAVMLPDGYIEIIDPRDIEDTPRYTLTPQGLDEVQNPDRLPMDALPHIEVRYEY